jgi:hypothetical protein
MFLGGWIDIGLKLVPGLRYEKMNILIASRNKRNVKIISKVLNNLILWHMNEDIKIYLIQASLSISSIHQANKPFQASLVYYINSLL